MRPTPVPGKMGRVWRWGKLLGPRTRHSYSSQNPRVLQCTPQCPTMDSFSTLLSWSSYSHKDHCHLLKTFTQLESLLKNHCENTGRLSPDTHLLSSLTSFTQHHLILLGFTSWLSTSIIPITQYHPHHPLTFRPPLSFGMVRTHSHCMRLNCSAGAPWWV